MPFEDGIPCLWMRGGTSKAACFLADDMPADPDARDALLLRVMGSPDPMQIDGIGGGTSLTSKVAILSRSSREDADVDYLFLQVFVDKALVSTAQGCGNVLAAAAAAAIERGLVPARDGTTPVRVHMLNTGEVALAQVHTPGRRVDYRGDTAIAGVPGTHAPVQLSFLGIAGSMCGALLPSGHAVDVIDGVEVTLIDNGMPVVVLRAADLGLRGDEAPEVLEADAALKARVESIRLRAGPLMNLGDVSQSSSPKVALVSPPRHGGVLTSRSFIPHRVHTSVGVFAAISLATASLLPEGPAASVARRPPDGRFRIEHPSGAMDAFLDLGPDGEIRGAGMLRTARKLFDGRVFPA
ncbi:MAG: 4-oxalomesaconate tautomerase [Pseudomonas sp.]